MVLLFVLILERKEFLLVFKRKELLRLPHVLLIRFLTSEELLAFYFLSFPAPFRSGSCFALLAPRAESGQKGIRPCVHLQKAAPSAALPQQPAVIVEPSKHRGMIREKK